jgi:hypothetical protein
MCAMPEHLDWMKLYRAALRETDPEKQPARIEEAKNAMKQALRMAVEYEDSDQRHAISDALSHLENIQRLKTRDCICAGGCPQCLLPKSSAVVESASPMRQPSS